MEALEEREIYGYTFCDACTTPFCGIKAHVKEGKITKIESWENFPNGPLCAKGYATLQTEYSPARLGYPLMRTNPKGSPDPGWIRISWEKAYEIIAQKLKEIREKYGPESVLFYVGDPKEPRLAVSRLASVFGSPNYGTESSTCYRAAALASQLVFGVTSAAMAAAMGSISEQTKSILIWGTNPAWTSHTLMPRLFAAKSRGVKFIVIDPRRTPTAEKLADIHLRPRPGTDGALALGMAEIVIERGLYDKNFVKEWVYGFDSFKDYVKGFTPDKVERITGVKATDIENASMMYAENSPGTLLAGVSTLMHNTNGVQNFRAILSLIAILGYFDVPGGVAVPTYPLLPFFISGDMLRTAEEMLDVDFVKLKDKIAMKEKRVDREFVPVWADLVPEQIQMNFLPEYVKSGKIKAALLFAANATMWPQYREYQEALEKLEFSVAVDYFLRPWTHNYVDIVLPAATNYERSEPFAVFGRKVYVRKPVVKPYMEARSDWQIVFDIAVRLGYAEDFWGGDTKKAMDWILEKAVGITTDEVQIPEGKVIPPPGPEIFRKYETGMLRKDKEKGFPTPTGKVEIWSTVLEKYGFDPLPVYKEPEESPVSRPELAEKYPLVLMTGDRIPVFTHSKHRELSWVREIVPFPQVNMNPEDAAKRGIKEGDLVTLETLHGSVKVKAHLTYMLPEGVVDLPHGWASVPEANANDVVGRLFDPISGFPSFKTGLCEVRRGA